MNKKLVFAALTASLCVLPSCTQPKEPEAPAITLPTVPREKRPLVAIMDFPLASEVMHVNEKRASGVLTTLFTTEFGLQGLQQVRLIERAQLDKVLNEQDLGDSGRIDAGTAAKIGVALGVKYIVTGQITRFATKESSWSTGLLPAVVGVAAAYTGVNTSNAARVNRAAAGLALSDLGGKTSAFTGRLDVRIIDTETGEVVGVAYEEGESKKVGIKIFGGGTSASFDDSMISQVFEPIVRKITPKLILKLVDEVS
jgi:curli biogenesis system outer membrane secretion channel CsgG